MVTSGSLFFGYGSLVDLATHDYQNPRKATVRGWRRQWVCSATREVSFLSAVKDTRSSIQGMIADVTGVGWDALDEREAAYNRIELDSNELQINAVRDVQIYVADPNHIDPNGFNKPILLSYLDCVAQGFYEHFGVDGVAAFFNSTQGWERPVKNDRAAPVYPRAQVLTDVQSKLVDDHLKRLSVTIVT